MKCSRSAFLAAAALAAASPLLAGSVSGRLLDAAGKPVAGAVVRWTAYRTDDQAALDLSRGSEPAPLGEASTGADGRFRIALDKPNVSVSLRIAPSGAPSIRLLGPFDSSDEIALDDLHAAAAERFAGRVTDDEGKPVAGARVRATASDPFSDLDAEEFGEAKTAADGSFTILDAPSAPRAVVVRASGYVSSTQIQAEPRSDVRVTLRKGGVVAGVVLDPAGKPAAGALVIAEEQAAETDAQGAFKIAGVDAGVRSVQAYWKDDFAVRRDNLRVRRGQETEASLRLAKAAAITGAVIDETSRKAIAGVRVGASSGGLAFGRRRVERSARTDAQGRFRLNGLAPRAYAVTASRDGFLSTSINGVTASTTSPGTVRLALARAASISGRVVDEKAQPLAGARVGFANDLNIRALLRRGPRGALGGPSAISGADGAFRIRNLAAARSLALQASKPGYATGRHPGLSLKTGEAVANVSLVLKKGLEARGKIVDPAGKPVAGAEVRVAAREGGGGFGGGGRQIRLMGLDNSKPDAVSGSDGGFVVRGLEEGEYGAAVSRDGYARRTAQGLMVKAGEENVWPPVALTAGVAIAGVVRDTQGQPIPGAQIFGISLGEGIRPQIVTSEIDGRFRLDGLAAQRPILLNLNAAGFASAQKNVTPPAEDVVVVLKTAGTVRGRVEDGDTKRPITDFTIARTGPRGAGGFTIQIGPGQGGEKAFQSDDGTFELPDVPAGKWTIRASAAGYRNGETSGVEVGEGETKEGVVVSLRRGGSLAGRVLNTRGTPVPNASVSWQSAGSTGGAMAGMFARLGGGAASNTATTSDADGQFRFDGLPEGKVTVTADHPDYLEASRDVDPEKESTVDISLGTGGAISGNVVGPDGRTPVAGALVSLNEEGDSNTVFGGANSSTRSDGNGGFLFEHLKGGRFQVRAQATTGATATKEVILAENQRQDGVLVSMSGGASVRGTVTGLAAGSLGGVRVSASASNFSDSTQTDDSGNFTFRNVPAGVAHFQANTSFPTGRMASANAEIPDGATDVPVQIVFEGNSTLSGRVTRGNQPLSGLFVAANADPPQPTGGRATAQTDDNGHYSLQGLNDGTFRLNVAGQGVSFAKTVVVSGDTTQDVQISSAGISGTVVEDGTGTPLEGAVVQVESGKETTTFGMKSATTDSSGNYSIDAVDPGTYQVTARKSGYQLKTQTTTVTSDPAQASFSLPKGSGITIQVADGLTGLPLHGVTALAFGANGGVAFQGSVSLDSTGRGEISSLSSGRYSIYVFSDGYAPRCLPAVDAPSPGVSVIMTPGGSVEVHAATSAGGRLIDASGMPYLMGPFRLDGGVNVLAPVGVWRNLSPGSYTLLVGGVGAQRSYSFNVAEGQTTRLDLK